MRRHAIFFLYFGFLLVFGPLFASQSLANVYVTNQSDDTVSVIDTTANSVTATIAVGHHPSGIAVNPAGTRAYVANDSDDTVSVIDTTANSVTATIAVGHHPVSLVSLPEPAPESELK
ncbi:MAG: hypothetical protein R6T98_02360 [Desulfatiglandales bacterium]